MKNASIYSKDYSVYPGEYMPSPEVEAFFERATQNKSDSVTRPPVNIDEFNDYYKVEVIMPGVSQQNICIDVQDTVLSVIVVYKESDEQKKKLQLHEFDTRSMERHILLPGDADAAFTCARYEAGVLHLYIPKTNHPAKSQHIRIVPY